MRGLHKLRTCFSIQVNEKGVYRLLYGDKVIRDTIASLEEAIRIKEDEKKSRTWTTVRLEI
jgi:hypothetical protein